DRTDVAAEPARTHHDDLHASVTQPSEAEATVRTYFRRMPPVTLSGGSVQAAARRARSGSSTSQAMMFDSASIVIRSPSRTKAIGPPFWASGVTCPTTNPWLPPEKRPSVTSAIELPRPAPMIA